MDGAPGQTCGYKRKEVVALRSIEFSRCEAATFEMFFRSRRDRDRYGLASRTGLCLRVRTVDRALHVFLKGIPCGVCYYARKEWLRSLSSSFMVDLRGEIDTNYHGSIKATAIHRLVLPLEGRQKFVRTTRQWQRQTQIPFGDDNKKGKRNNKGECGGSSTSPFDSSSARVGRSKLLRVRLG